MGFTATSLQVYCFESQTSGENGDCVNTEIEGLCFIVARWVPECNFLLTASSLREQQAPILIKTGIEGKVIYSYHADTNTYACMQELMFLTVMQWVTDVNTEHMQKNFTFD